MGWLGAAPTEGRVRKLLAEVAVSDNKIGRSWWFRQSVSGQVCHCLLAQAQGPHSHPTKTTTVWLLLATHSWRVNQDATSSVFPIHPSLIQPLYPSFKNLKYFTNQTSSKTNLFKPNLAMSWNTAPAAPSAPAPKGPPNDRRTPQTATEHYF